MIVACAMVLLLTAKYADASTVVVKLACPASFFISAERPRSFDGVQGTEEPATLESGFHMHVSILLCLLHCHAVRFAAVHLAPLGSPSGRVSAWSVASLLFSSGLQSRLVNRD